MAIQKPSHTFTKIHLKALRTNNFYILFSLSFTVFINTFGFAQDIPKTGEKVSPVKNNDTISVNLNDLEKLEVSEIGQDSTLQDSVIPKPQMLTSTVTYKAKDYTSFNNKEQKLYLYNEAEVYFDDMELKAGIIVIDYNKKEVYAGRIKDTAGVYTQRPSFKQGDNLVEPDSIRFNYETEKALIFKSQTEQQGMQIYAPITKKENDSVIFLYKGRFTTSKDIENPEYYFQANKIKLVPGKKIVVGLTNMVVADVPTPIGLPFGFFPLTKTQTSGVLIPSFGEQSDRGYFLQNGGYYFAISDYIDLAVLGDYYTNGSYGLRFESNYALRYKFNGNLGFRYENLINSERGFPDYSKSTIYNIRWSHSQDGKSSPNSRFSASVNLGSSKYYQESVNQVNSPSFLNNTMASSVSYSKTFQGEPQVNLSVAATHSQNTNTESINMTLPTVQASVSRIYPFEPKTGSKKGIIENINFQYNIRAENRIQTTDSLFFKKEMWDQAQNGINHSIPLTTNFKVLKHLSLSATTNYKETWTFKTVDKYYDQTTKEVVTNENNGFASYRTYDFSTSLGTTLYGMFNFEKEGEDKKIKALRHVMRPSISYTINPSFDQYYDTYEVISADGLTTKDVEYSKFENSVYGAPNQRYSNTVGLSLGNNIEMKVRDKDSTATEARKIKLLDNLNFSTGYDIAADSLNLSPVRISGSTQLLKDKMSVNFGATLNPYALDNNNNIVDMWNVDNGGSIFRLTSANVSMNYSLSNTTFTGGETKASNEETLRSGGRADDMFGRSMDYENQSFYDDEEEEQTPSDLYTNVIPWSLRLVYAINYTNSQRENEISSHSLMFSGDVELSPRWKVGASSGYDFKNNGFTYTSLRFERDLLSWRMSLNWIPFSDRSSWNFFIGIKSNLLKDLKYDKRKQPDKQL
ncbi:putative LPS assembly protein LptD [Xanthomarina sp. F2636L]|uniref:putative LPS assembly protein LptD n=1 Tax=Xanthomarina sp. F2636L TaxID=2996018 RepID=UPI00225E160A|nr:putative LPS assembly protein LptD [Xanthomarina sp. F2636L]MCX7549481.1 putative LPS assembly protein LptD [Xanthomarina sp. F2636L]